MALLLFPISAPAKDWLRLFAAEMPELEVRTLDNLGDPADIDVVAVGHNTPKGTVAKLPRLQLIASLMAGQEFLLNDPTLPKDIPIVRTGEPDGDVMMNETALMHVLRHHKYMPEFALAQQRHEWKQMPRLRADERRVGVMGLGLIGLAIAKMLRDHGFKVAGWARKPRDVEGIEVYHGRDQLAAFMARSDIAVNLLALTKETENFFNRDVFALLPKAAQFINLARGHHVVDADLIAALDSGQLLAATLDVFRQEPLPPESPLWAHPRITVMPHFSRRIDPATIVPRICENIRLLRAGRPLRYLVDREAGY